MQWDGASVIVDEAPVKIIEVVTTIIGDMHFWKCRQVIVAFIFRKAHNAQRINLIPQATESNTITEGKEAFMVPA